MPVSRLFSGARPQRRPLARPTLLVALALFGGITLSPSLSAQTAQPATPGAQSTEPSPVTPATGRGTIAGRVQNATTGQFLENARVRTSTGQEVFTNTYGEFRLGNVPAGEVALDVFYSGLQPRQITVQVEPGATARPTVVLRGTSARPATEDETIQLDEFVVRTERETDTAAIAVNEQRFAPNIKTVIETDAFGDMNEGNVGEFLKFLPGVTVDYVAADVRTVSVRGFGAAFSSVYIDGFRMASASSGSSSRNFEFEQVSINNAARVEVAKVPLPSLPADALGGSVNLIGKNSFEREGVQFNYRAYLNLNSEDPHPFKKTPGPGEDETYKVLPGFDFDLTVPLNDRLGFVLTGLSSNQFNEQHRSQPVWNFAQGDDDDDDDPATHPGATPSNPFLQQYQIQDGPKVTYRDSISARMDWRISDTSALWVGYQFNYYKSFFGNRNLTFNTGTDPVPEVPGGDELAWGPDFTRGATAEGSVRHGTSFRDKLGATHALLSKYRYDGQLWEFEAGLGASRSKSWYRDTSRGHFSQIRTTLLGSPAVIYEDISEPRPEVIRAVNPAGEDIDYTLLQNYRIDDVRSNPLDASDRFLSGHANVARDFDFRDFDLTLRTGVDVRAQTRDIRRRDSSWTFVGADGVARTADDNALPYLDTRYGVYPYWGFPDLQWPDPYELYDAFESTPSYFAQTTSQALNAARYQIQNSYELTETVSALFLQAEGGFMQGRLQIITGARFERTEDDGDGPFTPTAGSTLGDVQANWVERGYHVKESYDGIYPSLHANYNVTENFIARFAYAQTLGRPDFGNILPLVTFNFTDIDDQETDPGTIEYNNTGLQPWEADNWDLSLEYYFDNGGVLSGGVFRKDIDGFFETDSRQATRQDFIDLGLDPVIYDEAAARDFFFTIETTRNSAQTARITGFELSFRQPLHFIPVVGEYLTFFANGTKLDLDGSASADFSGFIEESGNVGLEFRRNPVSLHVNVNYRGRQDLGAETGGAYGGSAGGFREYYAPRANLDVSGSYRLSERVVLFASVRNLLHKPQDVLRYSSESPGYSRLYRREKFGVQITMGVKGTW